MEASRILSRLEIKGLAGDPPDMGDAAKLVKLDSSGLIPAEVVPVESIEGTIDHDALQHVGTNTHSDIDDHIADATLHRVINDAATTTTNLWSADKISTELGDKVDTANVGVANGVASLDSGGVVPSSQSLVQSVAGQTGAVNLTLSDISGTSTLALAGDLSGTAGAATVTKVQGRSFLSGTPSDGQVYAWNNSNSRFELTDQSGGGGSFTHAYYISTTDGNDTTAAAASPPGNASAPYATLDAAVTHAYANYGHSVGLCFYLDIGSYTTTHDSWPESWLIRGSGYYTGVDFQGAGTNVIRGDHSFSVSINSINSNSSKRTYTVYNCIVSSVSLIGGDGVSDGDPGFEGGDLNLIGCNVVPSSSISLNGGTGAQGTYNEFGTGGQGGQGGEGGSASLVNCIVQSSTINCYGGAGGDGGSGSPSGDPGLQGVSGAFSADNCQFIGLTGDCSSSNSSSNLIFSRCLLINCNYTVSYDTYFGLLNCVENQTSVGDSFSGASPTSSAGSITDASYPYTNLIF